MRMKELEEIRWQLKEAADKEAHRLWRLARNAFKHGCSQQLVNAIREEANWLHTNGTAYPDRLIAWDFEYKFKYAFK